MKEQLIGFETAKLAKEKVFDVGTMNYAVLDERFDGDVNFYKAGICKWNNLPHAIAIPTQSLLQRWLREIHSIDVWAAPCFMPSTNELYSPIVYKNKVDVTECDIETTYEEALEAGLIHALKLI